MTNSINYGRMMQEAMQGVLHDVLARVADTGLPGKHHFYITFDTTHPGVDMADWLKERYPQEITIVMQEWFDNLAVMPDRFTVTLNFGNNPEPMVIPFDAIKTFVDPSVEFGLRFDAHEQARTAAERSKAEDDVIEELKNQAAADPKKDDDQHKDAEVVSLDAFRKPSN